MPVAKNSVQDPEQCYLCGSAFSEENRSTRSHVIPRRWFGSPPPENLPTLPACYACNNDPSPREERLRNALVRMLSHDSLTHADVFRKAARSKQPAPAEMKPGYYPTSTGLLVPATTIALPGDEDVGPVFRGITRGLYYKGLGRLLPQDVPIRSVLLQRDDADRLTEKTIRLSRVFTYGDEFSFMPVINAETLNDSLWLYLVFNAGVVASFVGEAAQLQFTPARLAVGHPLRQDG